MPPSIAPGELQIVYAALGRTIWHVQYTEDALHCLITIKVEVGGPGRVTEAEALAKLTTHRRNTLGTAIRIATRHQVVGMETVERLSGLKAERDWLVHRSQFSLGDELLSPWGRSELCRRAERITAEAQALTDILNKQLEEYVKSFGHKTVTASRHQTILAADRALKGA